MNEGQGVGYKGVIDLTVLFEHTGRMLEMNESSLEVTTVFMLILCDLKCSGNCKGMNICVIE